jgi:glycosyltransferase involved in cell wall biosynthesis
LAARRILSIGVSSTEVCGVRDAARVLAAALRWEGFETAEIWCNLAGPGTRQGRQDPWRDWLSRIRAELNTGDIDGIVLHYSPWSIGPRGIPIHATRVVRAVSSAAAPVIGFLHELAYPFRRRGWRGTFQALAQRVALVPLVHACDALVVTTEQRAQWARSRQWLPARPTLFAPIFSNFPHVGAVVTPDRRGISIGVMGFGSPDIDLPLVGEALRLLRGAGRSVQLVLIGAPGPHSPAAAAWLSACSSQVAELRFTGVQTADEIARELAAVDIVLFADRGGASTRKGTLAAALAAAKPVVAVEGPEQWSRLVAAQAVRVASPSPSALAGAFEDLCADAAAREAQGTRAEGFYRAHMAPAVAAGTIADALRDLRPGAEARVLAEVG